MERVLVEPIRTDPGTGRKLFNTRAKTRHVDVAGYAVTDDPELKALPSEDRSASFSEDSRRRYEEFSAARTGTGRFRRFDDSADPYTLEIVEREALTDSCDILVVGAGFSALVLWYKLAAAGFDDVRFCERAGDVGGTWYWNRYPGIACDVEAYCYLPLLDQTRYIPDFKYASGLEILDYCKQVADRTGFYDHCLFNTEVTDVSWDDDAGEWVVVTDRGDAMRARAVVMANGILTTPQLPSAPGMETFRGDWFHSARWNHDVDLAGKRVGVVGTGATAVQMIPELARVAAQLYVFQRTPSTVDVRDQRRTTPEEIADWSHDPNWSQARRQRFAKISAGRIAMKGNDEYLSGKVDDFKERKAHDRSLAPSEMVEKQLESNFRIMEQIRARIDEIVDDPETAELLKPYYPYGCKRPTFHDEYLPAFNRPNVTLVDVAPRGIERVTEQGIWHDGREYELDAIVYATGFEWLATSVFEMIRGRDGNTVAEMWQDSGTRTLLGIHVPHFPNLFVMVGPQGGGGSFNFTDTIDAHSDYIVWMLTTMRERGVRSVDVDDSAVDEYTAHCVDADLATRPLRNCVSYYNGYGAASPGSLSYYGGPAWHRIRQAAQESLDPYEFS